MLIDLKVKDFALIENIHIQFAPNFNVLSGETGAGKSIIIDAVSLLLGARAKSSDVRIGAEKALVEGAFFIKEDTDIKNVLRELGMEDVSLDEPLILTREVSAGGKNICRINGRVTILNNFKALGTKLVNIYGQHDYQEVSDKKNHLKLLDSLGDKEFQAQKAIVAEEYKITHDIAKSLKNVANKMKERGKRLEYLKFMAEELKSLDMQPGDEERFEKELAEYEKKEKIWQETNTAYELLYAGEQAIVGNLEKVCENLEQIAELDKNIKVAAEALREAYYIAEDKAHVIAAFAREQFDLTKRKQELEEKLYALGKLKRKYNMTFEALLAEKEKVTNELMQLADLDITAEELKAEYTKAKKNYQTASEKLSQMRHELAHKLETEMLEHLADLAMDKSRFEVGFKGPIVSLSGSDEIEFMFSANVGQPLKPLAEIASGGEMSRIMLAFKTILCRYEALDTMIFDEIDTGIGGNIAVKVAEKLKSVSQFAQVICVTHAPQIAAMADSHYLIQKYNENERTVTTVRKLSAEEEIAEIARMLGGSEEYQLKAAAMMKQNSKEK
ncbi:MAG: DNA repair protein RecN [Clostridiales bacterium]|nr:MAG: DNA repair protein RecN [Clostridiales bacterium]